MGRMIVRVRDNDEGRKLVSSWRELGAPHGMKDHLFEFLRRAGVQRGSSYHDEAHDLGGTHHLFEVPDGQEILWMNEMFRDHNIFCKKASNQPDPNPIEFIDVDSQFHLKAPSLQGPVASTQTHDDYLNLLNVSAAHNKNNKGANRVIAVLDTGIND